MGITNDQRHEGAVRRLRTYFEALTDAPPGHYHFDAHAAAFTLTLTRSDEIANLVQCVAHAFDNAEILEEWEPHEDDPHAADPRLGLEVLELMLRAYALFEGGGECQWDGTTIAYDCLRLIEEWDPVGGRFAMLYLDEADVRKWCGEDPFPRDSWLAAHRAIRKNTEWVEATLRVMGEEREWVEATLRVMDKEREA